MAGANLTKLDIAADGKANESQIKPTKANESRGKQNRLFRDW